jgi:hypothetical protein
MKTTNYRLKIVLYFLPAIINILKYYQANNLNFEQNIESIKNDISLYFDNYSN